MWSFLAVLVALAGPVLSLSPPAYCAIQPFVVPLTRWTSDRQDELFTLGRSNEEMREFNGRWYYAPLTIGAVLTEDSYFRNQQQIIAACGAFDIISLTTELRVRRALTNAPCGAKSQLADIYMTGERHSEHHTSAYPQRIVSWIWPEPKGQMDPCNPPTTTPVPTLPPFGVNDIVSMTSSLYRYYSRPHIKHFYHTNANYVNSFFGADAVHYGYEGVVGKVLPYNTYTQKKTEIDRACPKLVAFQSVFQPTLGALHALFDQSFYAQSTSVPGNMHNYGKLFLAATEKGYCGANKAVYLVNSNRPLFNDWFYTSDEGEYNRVRTSNTFYMNPGNGWGVAFYIW